MTVALKRFRTHALLDEEADVDELERQKIVVERAEAENRETTSALLELRDLEDELLTLTSLFQTQLKCIKETRDTCSRTELRDIASHGRQYLEEALGKVDEYEKQVGSMIERVRNTRDDFARLLEMVQRQAQVDQARLSRQQALQNRSVLIFTTFTVIFLPLSFFTSLFGMNTREWGGGDFLSLSTIGAISLPTSAVLIAAALYLAWSSRAAQFFRFLSVKAKQKIARAKLKTKKAKSMPNAGWRVFHEESEQLGNRPGSSKARELSHARRKKSQRKTRVAHQSSQDFWQANHVDSNRTESGAKAHSMGW